MREQVVRLNKYESNFSIISVLSLYYVYDISLYN